MAAILDFDRGDFSYFWCTNCPDTSYQVLSPLVFRFKRRSKKSRVSWPFGSGDEGKIDFQDGRRGDHPGFPIGIIIAIFGGKSSNLSSAEFANRILKVKMFTFKAAWKKELFSSDLGPYLFILCVFAFHRLLNHVRWHVLRLSRSSFKNENLLADKLLMVKRHDLKDKS